MLRDTAVKFILQLSRKKGSSLYNKKLSCKFEKSPVLKVRRSIATIDSS